MTFGFTIASPTQVPDSVRVCRTYMDAELRGEFLIVLVGTKHGVHLEHDLLPARSRFIWWDQLEIESPLSPSWPLVAPPETVRSLLIPHVLSWSLATNTHSYFLDSSLSEDGVAEVLEASSGAFCLWDMGLSIESNALESSRYIAAVSCPKESGESVLSWRAGVDSLLTLSSITFDNSLGSLLPSEGLRVFDAPALGRVPQRQSAVPQEWTTAHNGLPIRDSLRKLALTELLNTSKGAPSPFEKSSADEFMAWGREVSPFSTTGLPRFLDAAMQENPETYREFVLQDAIERRAAKRWWRSKRRLLSPELDLFRVKDLTRTRDEMKVIDRGPVETGVDLFGYVSSGVGVGQAARLAAECLREARVDVSVAALQRRRSARIDEVQSSIALEHDVALMCVDAFGFKDQWNRIGAGYFSDRYTIAQWYWELEQVPDYYREPLSLIDEFWAPTRFLYEAMRTVAPDSVRVTHMPLPIRTSAEVAPLEKSALGIDGRFLFYFSFDFLSVMKRKNPEGIINAYLDAFEERDGAALLIKSINGIQRPSELKRLSEATRGRKDVHLVDEFISPHLSSALMATADCYVSLHRSEGYGLTLAEAMAMGKPVVATGYSGNLDFMNHENSLLIPFSLVPVGDGAEGYPASSMWAEPDHRASVEALQRIMQDRRLVENLGHAGRQHVEREFSFEVVGGRMRERLAEIRIARRSRPAK